MGGLALGNRFGGQWADTGIAPLKQYGYLEVVVGVLGLMSPLLADAASSLYITLSPAPNSGLTWLDTPKKKALAAEADNPGACFRQPVDPLNRLRSQTSVCTSPAFDAFDAARTACVTRFPTLKDGPGQLGRGGKATSAPAERR